MHRPRHTPSRLAVVAEALALAPAGVLAQTDPLPSWNAGAAKTAILKFVADTTTAGAPWFVPPAERIATFDPRQAADSLSAKKSGERAMKALENPKGSSN